MAVIFNIVHHFIVGEVFLFRSLSCIADQKGILHRVICVDGEAQKPRFTKTTEQKPVSQKRNIPPPSTARTQMVVARIAPIQHSSPWCLCAHPMHRAIATLGRGTLEPPSPPWCLWSRGPRCRPSQPEPRPDQSEEG
jgi:hypothetical protein